MAGISVTLDALSSKYSEVAELDEKIAAASGSESAGKRAIANQILAETQDTWEPVVKEMVSALADISDVKVLVGAFSGLQKSLKDSFADQVEAYLSEQVESRSGETEKLSADELNTLVEERKQLDKEYKAIRELLELFGEDVSVVPVPKRMTGSRGKRGPRVLSGFTFAIDGEERTASQNSLSSIANTVCKDIDGWKTKQLREFLVSEGIDLQDPPESFEVTLPNGKVLSATKEEVDDEEVEDEDDDE